MSAVVYKDDMPGTTHHHRSGPVGLHNIPTRGRKGASARVLSFYTPGATREQCRRLYWDLAHLARSRTAIQARPRGLDWRERFRAEAARLTEAGEHERAKAVIRVGWRMHCRQNRLDEAQARADSLGDAQARDQLLWDQLTSKAATDDDAIEALIAEALRREGLGHG